LGAVYAEAGGGEVDPLGGAFELGVVADGSFVDNAVALAVLPLGAPFFITERGDEAEGEKDLGQRVAVGDYGFGFDAVLVGVFAGANVREALVGEEAAAGIGADAEDFRAGAHAAVGGVIKDVGLEGAGGLKAEASGIEAPGEGGRVGGSVEAKFDFGFDGHG